MAHPRSSDESELLDLFSRSGPVARLVLPPARALALVEFTEPQDARGAFRYGTHVWCARHSAVRVPAC